MYAACAHKTAYDHVVGPMHPPEGRRKVWRCSHCKTTGEWSETWGYHGNLECSACWVAEMTAVYCSEACRLALAKALGWPTSIRAKSAPREKPPTYTDYEDGAKRNAREALKRLSPQARAEVLAGLDDEDDPSTAR